MVDRKAETPRLPRSVLDTYDQLFASGGVTLAAELHGIRKHGTDTRAIQARSILRNDPGFRGAPIGEGDNEHLWHGGPLISEIDPNKKI